MWLELVTAYGAYAIVRDVFRFAALRRGAQSQVGQAVEPRRPQEVLPPQPQPQRRGRQEQPAVGQTYSGMPMPTGVTEFEITITGRHYDF